jgi:hypothetical protein
MDIVAKWIHCREMDTLLRNGYIVAKWIHCHEMDTLSRNGYIVAKRIYCRETDTSNSVTHVPMHLSLYLTSQLCFNVLNNAGAGSGAAVEVEVTG